MSQKSLHARTTEVVGHVIRMQTSKLPRQTGAQPALHFGAGNFHELSFDDVIVLVQLWYVQLFRKRSQICSLRNI